MRNIFLLALVLAAAFAAFVISTVIWGAWWRVPNMPTAEEWSAFFGASALVALGFAWYQVRQVDQSNKALIASNELARQVNLESVRPRVQVSIESTRSVWKKRSAPVEGNIHISVKNIGPSPAFGLKLTVNPPFTSLETFFKPGLMDAHFAEVNGIFDGATHFDTLNPGNTYIWFLGRAPELFSETSGVPRRYEVKAEYTGTATTTPFQDVFLLDLDVEKRIELPADPLVRIGKDIEVVGDELQAIRKVFPRELDLSADAVRTLRTPRRRIRLSADRRS